MIITPSSGAKLRTTILAWSSPTLSSNFQRATPSEWDLSIPIKWAGIPKIAAVKAAFPDGTYLFDDWTRWLSPLQHGRLTYNNHWEFTPDSVILRKTVVDAVISAGQEVLFTFEFFPRVAGNSANFTLVP